MITLSSNFLKEIRRGDAQVIAHVRIEALEIDRSSTTVSGSDTLTIPVGLLVPGMEITGSHIPSNTTIVSVGSTTILMSQTATISDTQTATFKKIYNWTSGPSAIDGDQIIAGITEIENTLDPYTRETSVGTVGLEVIDDGTLRRVNGAYPLKGRDVTIKLGTPDLAAGDFAPYFRGAIEDIVPFDGGISIQLSTYLDFTDSLQFGGSFYSKHPLEVIEQLLLYAGVPAALIDADSFDPDHADNDAIDHYTITSLGLRFEEELGIGHVMNGGDNIWHSGSLRWQGKASKKGSKPGSGNRVEIRDLIDQLVFFISGAIYTDANGVIKFKHYDRDSAAARHLSTDDYREFVQNEAQTHIINDIRVSTSSGSDDGQRIRLRDTVAITEVGSFHKDEKGGIYTSSVFLNGDNTYRSPFRNARSSGDAINENFEMKFQQISGLTGTWGTVEDTAAGPGQGDLTFGGGSSAGRISASKPIILWHRGELIKVTAMTMSSDFFGFYPAIDDDGNIETTTIGSVEYSDHTKGLALAVATAGIRGFEGTTPIVESSDATAISYAFTHGTQARDVSVIYEWAKNYVLPRFAYGLATCEIKVSLEHLDLEIGDLVSLDSEIFLWRHIDGLSSTSTLEIVGREVQPLGDSPGIKLDLAMAKPATDPLSTLTLVPLTNYVMMADSPRGGMVATAAGGQAAASTPEGAAVSHIATTDRDIAIEGGRVAMGPNSTGWRLPMRLTYARKSKDSHIYMDPSTGATFSEATTTGSEGAIPIEMAQLGKAITGATTISAVKDRRRQGGILASQVDAASLDMGSNLIREGIFDRWAMGLSSPPIGWEIVAGVWGTDALGDATYKRKGLYSLKMPNTAVTAEVKSAEMQVEAGEIYRLGGWFRASGTGGTLKINLEWIDEDHATISTAQPTGGTVATADTWEWFEGFAKAPATAVYARARPNRQASTVDAYFDGVILVRALASFRAYLSSDQTPASGDNIDFDTEDHDHGEIYDAGSQKFTAPAAGVYMPCLDIELETGGTNAKTVVISLRKNSSTATDGTEIRKFDFGDIGTHTKTSGSTAAAPINLAENDTLIAWITWGTAAPTIKGGATRSNFSVTRIR